MTVRPPADVVAALDGAFAAAPRPTNIDACSCCIRAEEIAVLLNTPRQRLQVDDLVAYGVHVMNTVGGTEDLRYFAPRLLELSLTPDGMTWPDLELIFIKLGQANWWSWPEAMILKELMDALWIDVLTHDPSWVGTGELLCSLGSAQPSIAHRLHDWSALRTAAAIANLHEFLTTETEIKDRRLVAQNAYWDTASTTYTELSTWLNDGPALAAVEAAIAAHTSEAVQAQLTAIRDRLLPTR
ncbi:hypothetical protein [Actinocorallia aurantiaca]|uniref:Uncharacterized protein n=1 Tax=Actinocorallia aurantiaca TaxID=46204 RepID=A0ABP6HDX8_9ACTN